MQRTVSCLMLALTSTLSVGEIITVSNIVLDGFQPVPPTGSLATGLATVMINTETRNITIDGTFEGLEGDVLIGHLHGPGGFGMNSPLIIIPMTIGGDFGRSGTFHASQGVSQFQLNAILDSRSYINIHSFAYTEGEIRGQVVIPAPGAFGLIAMGGLIATRRRR